MSVQGLGGGYFLRCQGTGNPPLPTPTHPPCPCVPTSICGHRPKSSLGDQILAVREGNYKNCFREGEERHLLGYRKDTGRKFSFSIFFSQKYWRKHFSSFFLIFSSKCFMFYVFIASGRGEPWKIFFLHYWGVKNCFREEDCVLEGQPMGILPPSPCPERREQREVLCSKGEFHLPV